MIDTVGPPDPAAVLADPDACAAFSALARRLREVGYDGRDGGCELSQLARGVTVDAGDARRALDPVSWRALLACGVLVERDGSAALALEIVPMGSVLTLALAGRVEDPVVYVGPDSILLLEVVWRRGGIGRYAADLGTGSGFIAAALATRFEHVVAADVAFRCAAAAQMLRVLNPHLAAHVSAGQFDVARGLRCGQFDLVVANAPWVPEVVAPGGDPPRLFAAGGPTGFELPRRFLDEGVELLAPRGQAFVACLDITFEGGERPVMEHVAHLNARGFEVDVLKTSLDLPGGMVAWAAHRAPGAVEARHVVVVARAPTPG